MLIPPPALLASVDPTRGFSSPAARGPGRRAGAAPALSPDRPVARLGHVDSLGGYRIVRKLGEGARAEVFLGYPTRQGAQERAVAIKVFRPDVTDVSIAAEIEALSRAAGDHSLPLMDITTAPDGAQVLILERLTGRTLARLLRDRPRRSLGEAITILAPLALALRRLHLAGVVHGAVRQDAVLFDAAGAPVLACFGHAFPISPGQPPALLDAVPGVGLDIRAFADLTDAALGAVDHPTARALADWVASSPALESDGWFDELADRLFDLGLPEPIDFRPDATPLVESRVPGRLARGAPVEVEEQPGSRIPDWIARLLPEGSADIVQRARVGLRVVRPRVWVVAGVVGAALVAALVLVPPSETGAAKGPFAGSNSSASALVTPAPDAGPVSGDDPVAALVALLDARERCIRQLSVLCLEAVGQAGSAALAHDETLIRALQNGTQWPEPFTLTAGQVTIDERLGGSVILDLVDVADSEPASILLMKGEAGWRIRDYLEQ